MNKINNQILQKLLPVTIEEKGKLFLGIPTLISGGNFSITKILAPNLAVGWIVRDGKATQWKAVGVMQKENETYVYGEHLNAVALESVFGESVKKRIERLAVLARAFSVLVKASIELPYLAVNSILFLDDGGVCFLPPSLMRELVGFASEEEKCLASVLPNHPDKKGEQMMSYFLGAVAYRALTDSYPFAGSDEATVRHMIRFSRPIEPVYRDPGVKADVSAFVFQALDPGAPLSGLDAWISALDAWSRDGVFREVAEVDAERVRQEGRAREMKIRKRFDRKVFWEKNGVRIGVISGSVFIGLLIVFFTIGNALFRTRATKGYAPLKVAWTYYQSMNTLDVTTMTDCVIGDAGAQELSTVTNLFVVTRPMSPYDKGTRFVSAADWDAKGRPALAESVTLYGVTGLAVYDEKPEPDPVVFARYDKWYTDKDPTKDEWMLAFIVQGVHIEERLYFRMERKDWVIYRIERLDESPITVH